MMLEPLHLSKCNKKIKDLRAVLWSWSNLGPAPAPAMPPAPAQDKQIFKQIYTKRTVQF